jgi:hypothetical protein
MPMSLSRGAIVMLPSIARKPLWQYGFRSWPEGGRTNLILDPTICLSTQVRKQVPSICAERQWLRPPHRGECEIAVEVGKESPVSRWFPFERGPKNRLIDCDQSEPILAREMLGGGFLKLNCGREVDIAIASVDPGTRERALTLRLTPDRQGTYLVDHYVIQLKRAED